MTAASTLSLRKRRHLRIANVGDLHGGLVQPGFPHQSLPADVARAAKDRHADALAVQVGGLGDVLFGQRDDDDGELLPPLQDIHHRQALRASERHLLAAGERKGQLARADQLHPVRLKAIVKFQLDALGGKIALVHGHVKRRVLDVGDIAHRQADVLHRLGLGRGGCGAAGE